MFQSSQLRFTAFDENVADTEEEQSGNAHFHRTLDPIAVSHPHESVSEKNACEDYGDEQKGPSKRAERSGCGFVTGIWRGHNRLEIRVETRWNMTAPERRGGVRMAYDYTSLAG